MIFVGKSRPWDIGVEERGRELKERWKKENGMAVGEVRLIAEGRMIGWDDCGKFGGCEYCAGFEKYLWWNGKEVQEEEEEGEESIGIGCVRSSIFGSEKFLGQMAVQLKNSLELSRKMN